MIDDLYHLHKPKLNVKLPILYKNPGAFFSSGNLPFYEMRVEAESMGLVINFNDRYTHQWYEKLFFQ
jgi:hypothetical protein